MQELPLNGRNFVQLATLSPGVSGAGSGMRGTIMSGTRPDDLRPGTELFVNGNRENSNNYLYDGIDNNTRLTLVTVMRPNVEAIKEFKVQTNLYSADQGRNPGGQVNVVTKSGGNTIHGAIYEFLRNDRFDANNFFANRAGQEKPPFEQNQFGGAIGGPIVTNKTFFFADYDGFRQRAGARVRQHRADAEDAAGGLQRSAGDDLRPADDGRAPRRGGHPPALPRQCHSAKPLGPGDGQVDECVSDAGHFGIGQQPGHDADAHAGLESVRRAHRSHAKRTEQLPRPLFLVEDVDDQPVHVRSRPASRSVESRRPRQRGHLRGPFGPARRARRVRLGACVLVAPASGYARRLQPLQSRVHASRRRRLAINSANSSACPTPTSRMGRMASRFSARRGYTGIGQSRSLPIFRHEKAFQYVTNLTFAGEKHTIKSGLDVRRRHMGEFQTNRGNGRFNFSPNITNNPVNNTGGHVMASFLLGAPSLIEQDYLLAPDVGMRSTEYSVYVGDDWRASQKVTLNLGLRYELDTPFSEVDNLWASFDPTTATVLVAGRNGVSRTAGVKTFKKAFAPRLGFAYQVAPHTVVRGGAGLFWNTPGNGGAALRLHRHVPFGPIYSFNPGTQFVTRRVSDGFPTIPPLDLALADSPSGSVIGVDPNYRPGYAEQFNLTVEQELPWSLLLKASYVGNLGRHLDTTYNLNQAVPGSGPVNERRPFFAVRPALADVTWAVSDGTADYHAFQFSATKRLTHGLSGLLSYTWGHSIDTVGQSFGGGADGPLPQDPRDRLASRGNSPFDIRHRLTIAWNYALPGGWQVNGINTVQTGLPFTPTLNATTVNTGTGSRPDRIGDGTLSNPTVDRWFDISAFATPPPFTYGNAGRNILYGPGRVNFDFSVFKEFQIKEGLRLQFRTECFNVFNTPQFDLPNAAIGAANAGTITSIVGTPRQIQFGVKVVF